MKKTIVMILTAVLIMSCGVSCTKTNRTDILPGGQFYPGITVRKDGTLLLDHKPLYVFGVNLYDVFVNKRNSYVNFDIEKPFEELEKSGIPCVRINMGSYAVGTFAQYYYSPEAYFESLDAVVAAAEKHHVGIIASLCWNLSVIWEFCGETSYEIENKNSKTVETAKKYYTDVVKRYKNSPAIWAWEFGNEYNLAADLCLVAPATDYITSEMISAYYSEVASAIREEDPYRLIVGGDSELSTRPASIRKYHLWIPDTLEDVIESSELYAPSPMEAVSSHMYQYGTAGATMEETEFKDFNYSISLALEACRKLKKGYYIGEYGPGEFVDNGSGNDEINMHVLDLIHQACLDNKVQIALGWLCTDNFTGKEDITSPLYQYWYSEIERLNKDLKDSKKQKNIDSYWKKAENAVYTGEGYEFNRCTDYFLGMGNPALAISIKDNGGAQGGWFISREGTGTDITLEDTVLADGSSGKAFHISCKGLSSGLTLKNGAISGLSTDKNYKITLQMKTENFSGDGLKIQLGTPYFGINENVKCSRDGEWQLIELDVGSPEKEKDKYSIGMNFENMTGEIWVYDIRVIGA